MENLHLKNLSKEALFKDVHRPRLITFFNNKNLTRYDIEQLFKSFNIKTSNDVITAIYEIYKNEYSNKIALVNATLNYIIQITELNLVYTNDSMLKTIYHRKNIYFLRVLFYILSESFILKEFLNIKEIKILNENINKPNQIIDNNEILTFTVPTLWIEANLSTNENFKKI